MDGLSAAAVQAEHPSIVHKMDTCHVMNWNGNTHEECRSARALLVFVRLGNAQDSRAMMCLCHSIHQGFYTKSVPHGQCCYAICYGTL